MAVSDADERADVPTWDDDYLQSVAERLMHAYDLERDHATGSERFDMYGHLSVESQKQFLHQSLNWANYQTVEHVFVRRVGGVSRADLDALVDLGHDLAEDRIEADEEHHGTEFTFVLVVPEVPAAVRDHISGFRDRTLLKYGYYGAYEVNLVVVAPEREDAVASSEADVVAAFAPWGEWDGESPGLLGRLRALLG